MLANNCSFFNLFGVTIAKLLYHQPIQSSNDLAKQKQSTQFILISPLPLTLERGLSADICVLINSQFFLLTIQELCIMGFLLQKHITRNS